MKNKKDINSHSRFHHQPLPFSKQKLRIYKSYLETTRSREI